VIGLTKNARRGIANRIGGHLDDGRIVFELTEAGAFLRNWHTAEGDLDVRTAQTVNSVVIAAFEQITGIFITPSRRA